MNPALTKPITRFGAGLAAGILAAYAASASAQNLTTQTLDPIVVTAARAPEKLAGAVGDISVIGAAELAASRGLSLAEIIGRQPGVQFTNNGGPQTISSVYLRGANPAHTLVLIDGMRINGASYGGVNFPALNPALVERVEILRGSASSLYGSDAIGGVINIITKTGLGNESSSAWAEAGYGSYSSWSTSAGLRGAANGWDYSLGLSSGASRGFDAQRSEYSNGVPNDMHSPDKDGLRSHALSAALGYTWAPGHRLGISAYNGYTDGDYDTSAFDLTTFTSQPVLYGVHSLYRQQAYTLSSTDQISAAWQSVLRLGFNSDSVESRDPETSDLTRSERQIISWQHNFQLTPDQSLSVLAEYTDERLKTITEYDRSRRHNSAAGLIYRGRLFGSAASGLNLQASLRHDSYSDFGSQTTGNLGLDYDLNENWQIGIAGGSGFHAPTFNDLYYPGAGNPELQAEKSRNLEAHIAWLGESSALRLTAFENRIRDLIVWDNTSFMPENLASARLRGLSLSGEYDFGATRIWGSFDLLDPRNNDPAPGMGSTLIRRAKHRLTLGVEHQLEALRLAAEFQYTGKRYDAVYNPATFASEETTLAGFGLLNLRAAYDFDKNFSAQLSWNNVFNKDYTLVDGYNTPGSNFFLNLAWKI